ncbi:MAG: hypothetical protein AAGB12_01755 [Pseudomonadota bacterium]
MPIFRTNELCLIFGVSLFITILIILSLSFDWFREGKKEWPERKHPRLPYNYERYGIVPGERSQITIHGIVLWTPEEHRYELSPSWWLSGPKEASVMEIYPEFTHWLPRENKADKNAGEVRIKLWYKGDEVDYSLLDFQWQDEDWIAVIARPELGLTEYRRAHRGWGYVTFQSQDNVLLTPNAPQLTIKCSEGLSGIAFDYEQCWSGYRLPNGLRVWFFFHKALLPHWKALYQFTDKKVQSLLVAPNNEVFS